MKNLPKSQRGLTMISIIFILGLIAFFTLLILKIGPIYMDHGKVVNALEALKKTPDVENKSTREIRSILNKRFNMNYVDDIQKDDIIITNKLGYLRVEIAYERVEPIVGNLSVLVDFDNTIEAGSE